VYSSYPEALINIKSIPGLEYIENGADTLRIGSLTKLEDIAESSEVNNKFSAIAEAAFAVGTPQLRNMGTIAGNLCQECRCWYLRASKNFFYCYRKGGTLCYAIAGDNRYNAILGGQVCFAVHPSDTAIALTALNADIVTTARTIPIEDFYDVLGSKLADDEIISEIQVPVPTAGTKQTFIKFRQRKAIDFAISSVSTVITVEAGNVSDARVVLGGVAPIPYRARKAEDILKGSTLNETVAEDASEAAVDDARPLSGNAYLVPLTKSLVKRAILS
jgi:xanthine dehydrogenase YagS FAD-binding subunit